MLRDWTPYSKYQERLCLKMLLHKQIQISSLVVLDKSISKLYLLNLNSLLPIVKPLYPDLGRLTKNQHIIRSFVLMLAQQDYSIAKWAQKVASDSLLFDICSFLDKAPSPTSYYNFLIRLWIADHSIHIKLKLKVKSFVSKPKKKLKANQKQSPKHFSIVKNLVAKAINSKLQNFCLEIILQKFITWL